MNQAFKTLHIKTEDERESISGIQPLPDEARVPEEVSESVKKPLEVKTDLPHTEVLTRTPSGSVIDFEGFVNRTMKPHKTTPRGDLEDAIKHKKSWKQIKDRREANKSVDRLHLQMIIDLEKQLDRALDQCNAINPIGIECNELIHQSDIALNQVKDGLPTSLFRFMFKPPLDKIKNDDTYFIALADRLVILAMNILKYKEHKKKKTKDDEDNETIETLYGAHVDIQDNFDIKLMGFIQDKKGSILNKIKNVAEHVVPEESKDDDDLVKCVKDVAKNTILTEVAKLGTEAKRQLADRVEYYIDQVLLYVEQKRDLEKSIINAKQKATQSHASEPHASSSTLRPALK